MLTAISLLLLVVLLCSIYYEFFLVKSYYIPFFTLVSSYYFIFHGIFPAYAQSNVPHLPYNSGVTPDVIVFTLAFVGFQFAGYFLASRFLRFQPAPAPTNPIPEPSTAALKLAAWTLMAGYFAIHFVLKWVPVPSLPQLEQPCWYFSYSALVYLLVSRQLSRPHILALAVVVIAKLSIDLTGGFLTPIMFSLLIVISAAFCLKAYRTILLTSLICLSLFGSYGDIKHFSRTIINGETANIFNFTPEASLRSLQASFNSMARRSSHLLVTSHVMEKTPSVIPFDDRNPFTDALVNHVPRVFWPSKPTETMGNKFGKRYGILNSFDTQTSWNLPWTVDLYSTFGPILSVFSIFILGGIFGVCVRWLSSRPNKPFWFGVYSATLLPLFYQESNFSVMTGSLFSVLLFLLVTYGVAKTMMERLGHSRD